jgi:hypothetical protein
VCQRIDIFGIKKYTCEGIEALLRRRDTFGGKETPVLA